MRYIQHIIEPQELLLSWQTDSPENRMRLFVAKLIRNGNDADLVYLKDTPDFKTAQKNGFDCYPGLSVETDRHINILATFMKRLPPRSRNDFPKFLNALRLNPQDSGKISNFALLGYSNAKLPGDGFTVINPFTNIEPPFELLMQVQGYRFFTDPDLHESLKEGLAVSFQAQPQNLKDPKAIMILIDGRQIGYACKGLTDSLHRWIKSGYDISASIERINGTPERPDVFILVEISTK